MLIQFLPLNDTLEKNNLNLKIVKYFGAKI